MKVHNFTADLHEWNVLPEEALAIQKKLRSKVEIKPLEKPIKVIAGADISFNKFSDTVYAGIVLLSFPDLTPVGKSLVISKATFPYVPGLLSFREIPSLLEAWHKLPFKPDVIMMDGHGIAHPRRLGIAAHFGVFTDSPAIGCAKSLLTGTFSEPGPIQGDYSYIFAKNYGRQAIDSEKIGIALRTKNKVKPVFVSPGHKISFEQSQEIVLKTLTKYRLPEPTRQAHILVNKLRTGEISLND